MVIAVGGDGGVDAVYANLVPGCGYQMGESHFLHFGFGGPEAEGLIAVERVFILDSWIYVGHAFAAECAALEEFYG